MSTHLELTITFWIFILIANIYNAASIIPANKPDRCTARGVAFIYLVAAFAALLLKN